MRLSCLALMFSMSTSLFAVNKIEKLIYKHDLEPLVESEYWKNNPGKLPYSKCKVFKYDGQRVEGHSYGFLVSGQHYDSSKEERSQFTLFCYSKKERVAYQIPLAVDHDLSVGVVAAVSMVNFTSGRLMNLNNRSLMDIFGRYKGFKAGLGVGVGAEGSILKKRGDNIFFGVSQLSIGDLKVEAAYNRLHIGLRRLNEVEYYSHQFLERRALLIEAEQKNVAEINKNMGIDNFVAMIRDERARLESTPDDDKYSSTWRFWIHHLKSTAEEDQCGLNGQRRCGCQRQSAQYIKMFGDLDPEFLGTLTFVDG